jgi:hypothetical protein
MMYSATPAPLEKLVRAPQQPAQVQVRIPSLSQRQLVTLARRPNLLERAMVWRL